MCFAVYDCRSVGAQLCLYAFDIGCVSAWLYAACGAFSISSCYVVGSIFFSISGLAVVDPQKICEGSAASPWSWSFSSAPSVRCKQQAVGNSARSP
jgi:hypothetical protein